MEIKKKETLTQNITYMALMAAINVIFVLLTAFLPYLFFLIVFVLPLTSAIVVVHCKKIYFPIYAFATIGLCMVCTLWKIEDTIFYVIPSILSGFLFGLMSEKKVPSIWIIMATTVLQIGLTYASMPLIKLITGKDIVEVFATVFLINDFKYLAYVVPSFIFFMSLTQEIITYVVIKEELAKFGVKYDEPKALDLILFISLATSLVLTLIFAFVYGPISYLFAMFSLFFGIYSIVYLISLNKKTIYIYLIATLFVTVFLFTLLYKLPPQPLGLLFANIYLVFVAILLLLNKYLLSRNKNCKIE